MLLDVETLIALMGLLGSKTKQAIQQASTIKVSDLNAGIAGPLVWACSFGRLI